MSPLDPEPDVALIIVSIYDNCPEIVSWLEMVFRRGWFIEDSNLEKYLAAKWRNISS